MSYLFEYKSTFKNLATLSDIPEHVWKYLTIFNVPVSGTSR